jgi:acetyl esterase/lipase
LNGRQSRKLEVSMHHAILLAGLLAASHSAADSVRVLKDVDYVEGKDYAEGPDGKHRLDLYLPEGTKNFPVVVFFHGGGLRGGDKAEGELLGRSLAGLGLGAVSVNYRLSPEVSHPVHAEDAARSIAWVHRHIAENGGDPKKIFIAGHSAGAYLAALLATDPSYLRSAGISKEAIVGAVPISGFFWVELVAPDRPKDVWGKDEKVWPSASPAKYVGPGAPPMLLLYADGDDPWRRKQNEDMGKALKDQHADVEVVQIAGRDHVGILQQMKPGDPTFEKLVAFVKAPRE